ncbi:hypothetical protein HMPREF0970_02190 [Schaalia odontolytica F0309]|uniref:Uncharacterized protein n=1 Tax=Schaalia odontolytica F0309 TaxID=649742 RepID=D4U1T7_9ACTO|nr:hypothetical protein HMPREF0970_02190 [Schaalia odontolytica F0309]
MTTPTFADVDEALARYDYRVVLSILESLKVMGEDACYRRDVQAAAYADRLGRHAPAPPIPRDCPRAAPVPRRPGTPSRWSRPSPRPTGGCSSA